MIITRLANIEDLEKIKELFEEFRDKEAVNYGLKFDVSKALETLKVCLEKHVVVVLENDGEIVGGIAGIIINSMMSKEVVFNEIFFYIYGGWRGFSARLLKAVETICVSKGVNQIVMASLGHNERLDTFYLKQDYILLEKHYKKDLI